MRGHEAVCHHISFSSHLHRCARGKSHVFACEKEGGAVLDHLRDHAQRGDEVVLEARQIDEARLALGEVLVDLDLAAAAFVDLRDDLMD